MASIMQGTTPTAIIRIPTKYFLMSDVTAIDMKMENDGNITSYTMDDLEIDIEGNRVMRTLTEEETAALNPKKYVVFQGLFRLGEKVAGIDPVVFDVKNMIGVGKDG